MSPLWSVFSGHAHWDSKRARIGTGLLISEKRLLSSRMATWESTGQGQTRKVAASPWVLVTEQSVWKMMNWLKIIREGNAFESWHGCGRERADEGSSFRQVLNILPAGRQTERVIRELSGLFRPLGMALRTGTGAAVAGVSLRTQLWQCKASGN